MGTAEKIKSRIAGLLSNGRFSEALPMLTKACKAHSKDSSLWTMLGVAQGALGNYAEAVISLQRSIKLNPRIPEAWFYLGKAQQSRNEPSKALESYKEAVVRNPVYWEAFQAIARIYQQTGQPEKATESYLKAIGINPSNHELHSNLALAWKSAGKDLRATESFREALRLQPADAEVWFNLGNLHHGHRDLKSAEYCYRKAAAIRPAWVGAHLALGKTLLLQGKAQEALSICRDAKKLNPDNQSIAAIEASMLEQSGDLDGAGACLQSLIGAGTNDVTALITYAKLTSHFNNYDTAIALLEKKLSSGNYDKDDARRLNFALADLYDAVENYDQAFIYYLKGNQLKASRFDPREWSNAVDLFISFFTAQFFAKAGCASESSNLPIFIVGMPRTGSTLLEQILDRHSAVFGAGELPDMRNLVISLPDAASTKVAYPQCLSSLSQSVIDQLARSHLKKLASLSAEAQRVIDKMPGNYLHLGLIQILFPGASVLHTQRDPIDTCLSCFTRDLGGGASFSADLSALGQFYRGYRKLMSHWQEVLGLSVYSVHYEDLVRDTERVVKGVVDHCGLPWDSQCLDKVGSGRIVNTPSYGQIRKPLYTSSVHKWKHYEKHLGPLLDSLAELS